MWDSWEKTSEWSYGVLPEVGKTSGQWIRGNHAEIWAHPPTDYGCGVYALISQILLDIVFVTGWEKPTNDNKCLVEYGEEPSAFNIFLWNIPFTAELDMLN